jgi:hypothetical protein
MAIRQFTSTIAFSAPRSGAAPVGVGLALLHRKSNISEVQMHVREQAFLI